MPKYIDVDAIGIGKANPKVFVHPEYAHGWNSAVETVLTAPAADVVAVRHGRWIDRPSKRGYGLSTYCSCCGQHSGIGGIESNRHRAYCPNCGALMDKDGDEDGTIN